MMTAWPRKRSRETTYLRSFFFFFTFDGTGDLKEHIAHFEHLAKFQTQCVDIAQHEKLLIKQFPSSLRRKAFRWFSRLKAGSILLGPGTSSLSYYAPDSLL